MDATLKTRFFYCRLVMVGPVDYRSTTIDARLTPYNPTGISIPPQGKSFVCFLWRSFRKHKKLGFLTDAQRQLVRSNSGQRLTPCISAGNT